MKETSLPNENVESNCEAEMEVLKDMFYDVKNDLVS
jgi:hypothetical protein